MSKVKKNKKIVFDDTDTRHAKLKIRLQHDGLSQAEFFRAFITGYIEKDLDVIKFINKYKTTTKTQSKKAIKSNKKDIETGAKKMEQFGFFDGELEDIFDIIATEHPDL
jgi:hypothetical protein